MQEGVQVLAEAEVEGAADPRRGQRGDQAGGAQRGGDKRGAEGGQDPVDDPQGAEMKKVNNY